MRVITKSVYQTQHLGTLLSRYLVPGDIICLFGNLGSGKTVFTKGIASGLGLAADTIISPTFVLMRQYAAKKFPLYHFDFYRLSSAGDIAGLGFEEYFYGDGVSVVEWPERLEFLLPLEYLRVQLSIRSPRVRSVTITGIGGRYRSLCKKINENTRA
jgi:tRNA threonylcarbamoyladenosine biosynthesis protein TsaE